MNHAAQRVMDRCLQLAAVSDVEGETTRTYLSPAMRCCNTLVASWMEDAGMTVHIDAVGNLRGVRQGTKASQRLVMGSHLDTVLRAGAYDGILGVVMAIELLSLCDPLSFPVEVIGFSEEEGVRFGFPFIGSQATVGTLDSVTLARQDAAGISVTQAIQEYGLQIADLAQAKVTDAFGYFEIHIEQGPVLEAADQSLGLVTAIAGQSRYQLHFHGTSNHAGTTPMHLRHDAMAAAAAWITQVEATAQATPDLVATVGRVETLPGAGNVIAGQVHATLDVRSADDAVRHTTVMALLAAAHACGAARGVHVQAEEKMHQDAVAMAPELIALLQQAAGPDVPRMMSGAGHDAMVLAPHIPSAMLFVRSPGGLSHHPDESVRQEDIEQALLAGKRFLNLLSLRRMHA